jgi:hypothetical protein
MAAAQHHQHRVAILAAGYGAGPVGGPVVAHAHPLPAHHAPVHEGPGAHLAPPPWAAIAAAHAAGAAGAPVRGGPGAWPAGGPVQWMLPVRTQAGWAPPAAPAPPPGDGLLAPASLAGVGLPPGGDAR